MSQVWGLAVKKINALVAEHARGRHAKRAVTACPSCLFTGRVEHG